MATVGLLFASVLVALTPGASSAAFGDRTLPDATAGTPYSAQIPYNATGTGGAPVFTMVAGVVPPGLVLSSTGLVSGTPISEADAPIESRMILRVTRELRPDDPGEQLSVYVTVHTPGYQSPIPTLDLAPTTLPDGTVGEPYSVALQTIGGMGPYHALHNSAALPRGLALRAGPAGEGYTIEGTPTDVEQRSFTIRINDSGNRCFSSLPGCYQRYAEGQSVARDYTINVSSGNPELDPLLRDLNTAIKDLSDELGGATQELLWQVTRVVLCLPVLLDPTRPCPY